MLPAYVEPLDLSGELTVTIPNDRGTLLTINHKNGGRFNLYGSQVLLDIQPEIPFRYHHSDDSKFAFHLTPQGKGETEYHLRWRRTGTRLLNEPPSPPLWADMPAPDFSHLPETGLHLLCPAGIGDFIWIWSKFWSVAQKRDITFWFPEGEQKRAGQYAKLVGAKHDYLPGLWTEWVWNRPGDPVLPKEDRGWVSVQANLHLECGRYLSTWYPELPLKVPEPTVALAEDLPKQVLLFCCHEAYMEGNLTPEQWAEIAQILHRQLAPVRLVGAGRDVAFAERILEHYHSPLEPLFNKPLETLLSHTLSPQTRLMVAVASGPSIAAVNTGCPAVVAYPRWLEYMPGSWEPEGSRVLSCFTQELPSVIQAGQFREVARG
jgi:hypothetical protein